MGGRRLFPHILTAGLGDPVHHLPRLPVLSRLCSCGQQFCPSCRCKDPAACPRGPNSVLRDAQLGEPLPCKSGVCEASLPTPQALPPSLGCSFQGYSSHVGLSTLLIWDVLSRMWSLGALSVQDPAEKMLGIAS